MTRSKEQWWAYANSPYTNNYALKKLARNGCCNGEHTESIHLENAKKLLSRFTFVLDQDCLDESLEAFVSKLGLSLKPGKSGAKIPRSKHSTARERIGNDTLYNFLVERNRQDIDLYEWSKKISLIDCSEVIQ
eukprot:CAMPEP_0198306294 /NCGR_PEP_ID=MMETSP1449-20131203/58343_1 /TAXON_ID=420275 /ORGANISM="Attheya septentrionalis, Strain CCMP2084" /LENGTH=132 /DNA_ID=CAMNT_0044008845 /DNA_START=1051 /DNA_END=1449 /DNA_ORIENTATION=+